MSDLNIVHIGLQRLDGLYLLDPPVAAPASDPTPRAEVHPADFGCMTHTFTDDVRQVPHLRDALVAHIAGARTKVLFCSFILADPAIVEVLCAAAARLHGGVYVLTALEKEIRPEHDDDMEDAPTERQHRERRRRERHVEALRKLAQAGVWMREAADCHAKFCVVDDEIALVTSANATDDAYTRNPENGVVVARPAVARELGRFFARFWFEATTSESAPGEALNVRTLPRRAALAPAWGPLAHTGEVSAVGTLGAHERSLRTRTIALLDGARRELAIVVYSVVAIEQHPVGAALRRALLRGVSLLLVVRRRDGVEEQQRALAWLVDGIPPDRWRIRGHARTHAKAIVADGARALLWTGNLDGHHGYEDGFEVGVEVTINSFAAHVRAYVASLADRAPAVPLLYPTLAELAVGDAEVPLSGAWTLHVPARLRDVVPRDLPQRLGREVVQVATNGERFELRVGGRLDLGGYRDEATQTLTVTDASRTGREGRTRGRFGYVGACAMRVVFEPAGPGRSGRRDVDTRSRRRR